MSMTLEKLQKYKSIDTSGFSKEQRDQYNALLLAAEQEVAAQQAVPQEAAPQNYDIIEEQHPSISDIEREALQNFAINEQAKERWVKQNKPELETAMEDTWLGPELMVRGKGEGSYRKIDPGPSAYLNEGGLSELGKDFGDLGYDLASGVGQGLATIKSAAAGAGLGGLMGAPAGPFGAGGGAIYGGAAGALAGGAASAGAAELGKQALGSAWGIPDNYDPNSVAMATGLGGMLPIIGPPLGKLLNAGSKGTKNLMIKGAAKLTGYDPSDVMTLIKNYKKITNSNALNIAKQYKKTIKEFVDNRMEASRNAMKSYFANDNIVVDITPVKKHFDDLIAKLEGLVEKGDVTGSAYDRLQEAKDLYNKLFNISPKAVREEFKKRIPEEQLPLYEKYINQEMLAPVYVPGDVALSRQQQIKDYAKFMSDNVAAGGNAKLVTKELAATAKQASKAMDDVMDKATEGISKDLRDSYKKALGYKEQADSYGLYDDEDKDLQKFIGFLRNRNKKDTFREFAKDIKEQTGLDLDEASDLVSSADMFGTNPTKTPNFSPAGLGAGLSIGAIAPHLPGAAYPALAVGGLGAYQLAKGASSPSVIKKIAPYLEKSYLGDYLEKGLQRKVAPMMTNPLDLNERNSSGWE